MPNSANLCTVCVEYVLEDPSTGVRTTEVVYELEQEPQTGHINLPIFAVVLGVCTASSTHVPDTHRIFTNLDGSWICYGTKGEILRVDRPPSKRLPGTTKVAMIVQDGASTLDTLRVVLTSKTEISKNKGEILFRPMTNKTTAGPEAGFTGKLHQNSTKASSLKTAPKNPRPRSSYLPARDTKISATGPSSTVPSSTTSRNRLTTKTSVAPAPSVPLRDAKEPPRWTFGRPTNGAVPGATPAKKEATLASSVSDRAPRVAAPPVKVVSVPKESSVAKSRSTPAHTGVTVPVRHVCDQCGQTFVRAEGLKRHQLTVLNCATKKKRNSIGRVVLGGGEL